MIVGSSDNCTTATAGVPYLSTIKNSVLLGPYDRSFNPFTCPNCGAYYQVVKVEAGPETTDNREFRAKTRREARSPLRPAPMRGKCHRLSAFAPIYYAARRPLKRPLPCTTKATPRPVQHTPGALHQGGCQSKVPPGAGVERQAQRLFLKSSHLILAASAA